MTHTAQDTDTQNSHSQLQRTNTVASLWLAQRCQIKPKFGLDRQTMRPILVFCKITSQYISAGLIFVIFSSISGQNCDPSSVTSWTLGLWHLHQRHLTISGVFVCVAAQRLAVSSIHFRGPDRIAVNEPNLHKSCLHLSISVTCIVKCFCSGGCC